MAVELKSGVRYPSLLREDLFEHVDRDDKVARGRLEQVHFETAWRENTLDIARSWEVHLPSVCIDNGMFTLKGPQAQ